MHLCVMVNSGVKVNLSAMPLLLIGIQEIKPHALCPWERVVHRLLSTTCASSDYGPVFYSHSCHVTL